MDEERIEKALTVFRNLDLAKHSLRNMESALTKLDNMSERSSVYVRVHVQGGTWEEISLHEVQAEKIKAILKDLFADEIAALVGKVERFLDESNIPQDILD